MRRKADRILAAIFGRPWLITEDALAGIAQIAEGFGDEEFARRVREEQTEETDTPTSMAGRGVKLEGARRATLHGSVAVLEIHGPILRRADMFSEISGATGIEPLAHDLALANQHPDVSDIVLYINSPGGQVDGPFEFAEVVHRSAKPVHVYSGGIMCSAAFLIGSAGQSVTVSETCIVGSLGTVSVYVDSREKEMREGRRTYQFRSSQSPRKNLDPTTPEGRDAEQALLDSFTATFISRVARYRSTTEENVAENFGQGGVFLGPEAVRRGMVDRVGLLSELISELNGAHDAALTTSEPTDTIPGAELNPMDTEKNQPSPDAAEPAGAVEAHEPAPPPAPAAPAAGEQVPEPKPDSGIDLNSEDARLLISLGEEAGVNRERKRLREIFESPKARSLRRALGDRYFDMIFNQGCDAKAFVYAVAEDGEDIVTETQIGQAADAAVVDVVGDEPTADPGEGDVDAEEEAFLQAALEGAGGRGRGAGVN